VWCLSAWVFAAHALDPCGGGVLPFHSLLLTRFFCIVSHFSVFGACFCVCLFSFGRHPSLQHFLPRPVVVPYVAPVVPPRPLICSPTSTLSTRHLPILDVQTLSVYYLAYDATLLVVFSSIFSAFHHSSHFRFPLVYPPLYFNPYAYC